VKLYNEDRKLETAMTEREDRLNRAAGAAITCLFVGAWTLLRGKAPTVPEYMMFAGFLPFIASELPHRDSELRWFLVGVTVGVQAASLALIVLRKFGL
jgi:hypothetical protein